MSCSKYPGLLATLILSALIVLVVTAIPGVSANGDEDEQAVILEETERKELKYPNLGSVLNDLVVRVEDGEMSEGEAAGETAMHQAESVAVTIHLISNVQDVVQFLEDNGGDPRNVGEDYIEAYVPVPLLGSLSEQPGVIRVREIVPPEPAFGPVTSQGVQAHLSAAWNQAGFSGQGVKVGIIDGGFEGFSSLMGSELPTTVEARCYTDLGVYTQNLADCEVDGDHGTIVAESLIDIAPEISLYIANGSSKGDLQTATDWMIAEGVTVINASLIWTFDGPGDGTSERSHSPLNAVDRAVGEGIIWVNSAGNSAENTWFGTPSSFSTISSFMYFAGSDYRNNTYLEAGDIVRAQLRWDDSWAGATTDLDICLFHPTVFGIGECSVDIQSGRVGDVPFEFLFHEVPVEGEWYVIVSHENGDIPDWIQLVVFGDVVSMEYYTLNGSITNPAESANQGMLAVGAAPWYNTNTIETYSGRGPTPDGRYKPDIVGADCGETELSPLNSRNRGFCGTSQAAPHVAGLAALVKQANPSFTPEQVADYLKNNAAERGASGRDNTWGYGFAQLPAPDAMALPLQEVVFAEPNLYSVQLQNHIARYMVENGYGYATSAAFGYVDPLLQGLRNGDIHVHMEVWLPNQKDIWDAAVAAGEVLDLGTSLGKDWQSAFVIPAYLQEQHPTLDNVEDLREQRYKDLFATAETNGKARLVSCVIRWACEEVNRQQIEGYGLADHVDVFNPSSEAELNSSLKQAYDRGEAWLGYQWGTSDAALLLELVRLDEPEYSEDCWRTTRACAYSDATILIGANSMLPERAPEVADFLREWDFDVDVHLSSVARWQAENPDASDEDAALHWLSNNVDTWTDWVSADAAAGILASLPGTDACGQAITADGPVNGTWAAGCPSTDKAGSYARYYSFSLTEQSEVTIDLESSDADTVLYLRSGANTRSGTPVNDPAADDDAGDGTNAQIQETLAPGDYTIEATTYNAATAGSFTLRVSGLGGTTTGPGPGTDACGQAITADGPVNGTWAAGCPSTDKAGSYARYYSFSLTEQSEVTIDLESSDADTVLYLRSGANTRSGTPVNDPAADDDAGDGTNAQIQETLAPGDYTIEATTYNAATAGSFTLRVSGLGGATASSDRAALVALYNATGGARWTNRANWLSNRPIGEWHGVTTDGTGLVTRLDLAENGLTGEMPAELARLSNLTVMSVWGNQLTGPVPTWLGNLTTLEQLLLSNNQLTGAIPSELGNLSNLERLDLDDNPLTPGPIASPLGSLSNLRHLDLNETQLTGPVPAWLGNLSNLEYLNLGGNQLTGAIPTELARLSNLTHLYLWGNELSGPVPAWLGNLTSLQRLELADNQLTGPIPTELARLSNLTRLGLWGNELSGPVPAWLGRLTELEVLSLSRNQLTGSIPPQLGNLTNLEELYLNENQLTGPVPAWLGNLSNLEYLNLADNQLTGPIPTELARLSNLTRLGLWGNELSGPIPPQLGNLSNLELLYLNENQLTGAIPSELARLSNLTDLRLWGNLLTGPVPTWLGDLSNLEVLYMSRNRLSGEIPPQLGNLTNLEVLNLNHNRLNGEIPAELARLSNLVILSLRENQLTGPVPAWLGSLTNLERLLLSNNQLTGPIPPQLGNLTNLERLYLSGNQLTGCVPLGLQGVADNDFPDLGLPFCGN